MPLSVAPASRTTAPRDSEIKKWVGHVGAVESEHPGFVEKCQWENGLGMEPFGGPGDGHGINGGGGRGSFESFVGFSKSRGQRNLSNGHR